MGKRGVEVGSRKSLGCVAYLALATARKNNEKDGGSKGNGALQQPRNCVGFSIF